MDIRSGVLTKRSHTRTFPTNSRNLHSLPPTVRTSTFTSATEDGQNKTVSLSDPESGRTICINLTFMYSHHSTIVQGETLQKVALSILQLCQICQVA